MRTEQCNGCVYDLGHECDRCVSVGMCGSSDRTARDYLREGETCKYRREGVAKRLDYNNRLTNAWGS
jgi:hypothetical protein